MNLFSLFRSSSIEILFSERILVVLYAILALMIFGQMGGAYVQFLDAYFHLRQFDVPAEAFVVITLGLLLPFWGVGALMLRACLQRLRLALWVRQATKVATYATPLSPAEAGFLVDYSYTHRELAATLLDLHFRGVIYLSVTTSEGLHIEQGDSTSPLSPYEEAFMAGLADCGQGDFSGFTDRRLVAIARSAHEVLIDGLVQRHMIQRERLPSRSLRKFFRTIYFIAGTVGVIYMYAFITHRAETLAINYPRYPVAFSELFVLFVVGLVVVGIVVSSYWPRFVRDYKDPQYEAWIDAAGFMLYLRTVYADRFSPEHIASQDMATVRSNAAYAVAYGVIPANLSRIAQILAL